MNVKQINGLDREGQYGAGQKRTVDGAKEVNKYVISNKI